MKNPKAPLRTSETSYLLLGEIMRGVTLAPEAPKAPKAKMTVSRKKVTKKVKK